MTNIEQTRRYGTPFLESECLLAVTADDEEYAESLLRSMTKGELRGLSRASGLLAAMAGSFERRAR